MAQAAEAHTTSRRNFLAGAVALPAVAVLPTVAKSSGKSPFQQLVAEWQRVKYSLDHPAADPSDEAVSEWGDQMRDIEERVINAEAVTLDDLNDLIEGVREDFREFHFPPGYEADLGERLVLASFDKVLRVLRRLATA